MWITNRNANKQQKQTNKKKNERRRGGKSLRHTRCNLKDSPEMEKTAKGFSVVVYHSAVCIKVND